MRADKFLWSVRLFKTRTDAAEACKLGRVLIDDSPIKASRELKVGQIISIKKMPAIFSYRILELIGKRQGAALVPRYIENITPEQEYFKLEMARTSNGVRDRGAGRPTKKDRRLIEDFMLCDDEQDDE